MDFPAFGPGFGSGGLRFRSHLNTNGHLGAISYGHSHVPPSCNTHSYPIPNAHSNTRGNAKANANGYTYTYA